ncbi:protein FREE1 [Sesamum angolense]|uniref:Protein FREE1 n=1 Tax=Sesamum angolense TaxID=2727404 RepID=A0AAE1WIK8_9LAMI|nr:protein FREE1 [Sesamum angolense]
MQQQTDTTASSYYHQYYQNATAADPPPFNAVSAGPYASAPPVTVSPSDYSNFPSTYPSFPPNPEHVPNPPQYSFPHLHDVSQHQNLYHQNQAPVKYDYVIPTNPSPNTEPKYDPSYSLNYSYGASAVPYHGNMYESNVDYGGDQGLYDGGIYKYNGGQIESSYGGKGGRSSDSASDSGVMFDDYGRPISVAAGKEPSGYGNPLPKIVKAVPKVEDSEDVKSGIQKFRVKVLSEGFGQTDMDVLCQSKEIGSSINPSDLVKGAEPSFEKKKGFIDWKNLIKPVNEEKDHWVPDEAVTKCTACGTDFSAFNRKEEMDKKRKTGANPEASGTRMREVACPICTVHLQVRVPSSGSETIECSVCQHPFLVSAQ